MCSASPWINVERWGCSVYADYSEESNISQSSISLTLLLKNRAAELGFVLTGVTAAASPPHLSAFKSWLESDYHGQMQYLWERRTAYDHPSGVLDGCRSLLMLALPYDSSPAHADRGDSRQYYESTQVARGKVARYARSQFDYHDIIHARLKELKKWLLQLQPAARIRGVVDTAPLLEREFAAMAGLGWIGKNTLLLNKHWGSYFFLAALLTDLELDVDEPTHAAHCGTCTACLDSCPTQAFPEPYVLDARKCISYTTIENREEVNATVAEHFQDWLFGCDICQEVCPWNRHQKPCDADLEPQQQDLEILDLLRIDESSYRKRFRKTSFWRARRRGLLRNAILLAAAKKLHAAEPELEGLLYDAEPLLRKAAAWALHRLQPANWRPLLSAALEVESDEEARGNLERLLDTP